METINQYLPMIELVGLIITGITVLILRRSSGVNQVSGEVIATYEIQNKQLKEDRDRDQKQIQQLTSDLGRVHGILEEKDKEIARIREILENRNPELVGVLSEIKDFMVKINKHMEEHTRLMHLEPVPQLNVRKRRRGKRGADDVLP